MIICATGHRPNKLGNEYGLDGPISKIIFDDMYAYLIDKKPAAIISGMALGVDQIWAIAGIRAKIPVIAAIPCNNQEKLWPLKSKELYSKILSSPLVEKKIISPGMYSAHKMQLRNQWMVDNSDIVFAVWDGTDGGTKNCIDYAISKNKMIHRTSIKWK